MKQPRDAITPELLSTEVQRRRTFAIISHPDAGKTTLTEKLLLYAGAVHLAGAVRARRTRRHAVSDWMTIEQERGISITTTALQFKHGDHVFNLLDTPGHQDFSEDTYRTLMAVDSAIMVLDNAKGIETQTMKLFAVCRMRRIPILTFINKLDRLGREPLDLLGEIERLLGILAVPMNWPIGQGPTFQGIYDLRRRTALLSERLDHGQRRAPTTIGELPGPRLERDLGREPYRRLREEVELMSAVGPRFETATFLAGGITPVFFGSALINFGVEPFFDALKELAPPPGPRESDRGHVEPTEPRFSGFVFKIQANMDPLHRDRMAFVRVCSGRFERDMTVYHSRLRRRIRMTRPHRLFAQDREPLAEAYPGDVVGCVNPGLFAIGDTVTEGSPFEFPRMPRFQPEAFGVLRNLSVTKYKQFHRGVSQLEEEGAIQVLVSLELSEREPVLAAVGELQFDIVQQRLKIEYGLETAIERLPFALARWVSGPADDLEAVVWPPMTTMRVLDREGRLVILFGSSADLTYCVRKYLALRFDELG
jgi:peptide chain release factor 3